uniref:AlNc14C259G9779 protein n=1 Tax=Albugo laibachii Nc14 TaxID=890382 RepID=F0WTV4_9STRA|nr:AlNc14C259G9779 [Albugo laibachii Nc14]|eukprot:CCA24798.1 AlNc14C259G9779 [Albugo laibachii Nc14]
MDHTVRVWSIPALNQSAHHTSFLSRVHTGGVRVAKSALAGTHYVSGGYGLLKRKSVIICKF